MIHYEILREVFNSDTVDIIQLLNQLSDSPRPVTILDVERILEQPNFYLLVARDDQNIVGMASVWVSEILMGKKAFIDDVVVLDSHRGQGIGENLIKGLIGIAKNEEVNCVELTSNPSRVAANNLYQKLGFQKRDTNVYRLSL